MIHTADELNKLYNEHYVGLVMDNDYKAGKALAAAFKHIFPDAKRIADIGCNNGVHMAWMIKAGFAVEGFDISTAAVEKAIIPKELIHLIDLRQPLHIEKSFDMAYAIECIEHIELEALPQFIDNMKNIAPIFVCTPGNQAGIGHFIDKPSTWWIYQFVKQSWTYDIKTSAELHDYFDDPQWDITLRRFPFPRKGIMVFRYTKTNLQSVL